MILIAKDDLQAMLDNIIEKALDRRLPVVNDKDLVSERQAIREGYKRSTLYKYGKAGKLTVEKIGKTPHYKRSELDRLPEIIRQARAERRS